MSSAPLSAARKASPLDWIMLTLACVSIGLLCYAVIVDPPRQTLNRIFITDTSICGIFALEFVVQWVRDTRPKSYPIRYWYDLLGMVPGTHPVLRGLRLLRIARIVVAGNRSGQSADLTPGQAFTYRILRRFKHHIADTISDAVALRIFDQVTDIVEKGTYTQNLAAALENNRDAIHHIVVEKVGKDPALKGMRYLPYSEELVSTLSLITERVLIELLRDHRTDRLGTAIVRENLKQIREVIRQRDEAREAET